MTLGDLAEFLAQKCLSLRVATEGGNWVATLYSGRTPAGVGAAAGPEEAIVRARVDYHDLRRVGHAMTIERTSDGSINNCALANGDVLTNCQMCQNACPDRARL